MLHMHHLTEFMKQSHEEALLSALFTGEHTEAQRYNAMYLSDRVVALAPSPVPRYIVCALEIFVE